MVFGMMYVVFALFLLRGRTSAAENFPVELLVGIVVWTFFADATVTSLSSIVANGDMASTKGVLFPRWILVAAAALRAAMTLLVNMALVIGVGLALNWFHFGLPTLIVIPILVELYVVSVGVGLLLAATFVFYRDLSHVWEIGLQFLFYASAIVFPLSLVPSRYLGLVALNPMAQMIEDLRRALVSPSIQWSASLLGGLLVVPIALSVICLPRRRSHLPASIAQIRRTGVKGDAITVDHVSKHFRVPLDHGATLQYRFSHPISSSRCPGSRCPG